ncbi:RNA-binding protein 26 [Elysia marginata]|uniref:RNA-binding protein 26 n=1 Tax=Elysia marginata TaxID=1093978 RepID=A0AAV4GXV8_9GAST|nr:RNA-binding protein 26 [Elysia marginata]
MIIEQVEALKTWLTAKLSPICDAEPGALAKYVCALVKKDKSEQDLRDICVDQLDVFLQQNTRPFVNDLFEALKSKAYIPPASEVKPKPSIVNSVKQENAKTLPARDKDESLKKKNSEISSTTDDKENKGDSSALTSSPTSKGGSVNTDSVYHKDTKESTTASSRDPQREVREPAASSRDGKDRERGGSRDRDRRDSWRDERSRDAIRDARDIIREREKDRSGPDVKDGRGDTRESKGDTREVREPRDRSDFRERDRDFRRRRTRSRSFSPRRRDFDDRPNRRRFEERSRYSPDRRWGRRRSWSRSPRRNRSPLDIRGGGRLRSRSPRLRSSRSPRGRASRSPVRYRPLRSRTRSRSPRPRSWSRPGSGGARPRSRSLSLTRQPDSRGSTPLQDNDFISSSTNDPAVTSTVGGLRPLEGRLGDSTRTPGTGVGGTRARCQNFEEKGFCMLGDVCPYDHGADPVVVEDDTLALGPGAPGLEGPDLRLPPPSHLSMQMNISRPPPSHVEPYLPENPSLQVSLRPPFMRLPPPDLRQPPPGMGMSRPPGPPDMFLQKREVIMARPPPGLNDRELLESGGPSRPEPSRIVIPSKRPYSLMDGNPNAMNIGPPPPRMAHINQHHQMFGPPGGISLPRQPIPLEQQQPPPMGMLPQQMQQGPVRKGFDFNRLGGRGFKHQGPNKSLKFGNMTLEVRKIPQEMNNIAKLNEHFGKFGTLTNIQVKFQGDPGAALISFSTNAQAAAAYRSPEPVFNNRFIKLFWHNAEKPLSLDGERETPVGGVVEDQALAGQQQTARTLTGGRIGDGIDHPSLVLPVRPSIPPAHKMSLDNTKKKETEQGGEESASAASAESKSIVYTSSVGNLKKTVFNSAAATPAAVKPKPAPFVSPTAVQTADYVSRMEAIKRIEEERKLAPAKQAEIEQKKQELLSKQIEQQKKLLETLDKKRDTMSEAEKQMLRTALRKISDAIDTVKYGTGAKKTTAPKNPQQFKYVSHQEQAAAAAHPVVAPYNRGGQSWSSGGRGGFGWASRGRGRGWAGAGAFTGRTTLDNRPKTVEVKGFDLPELDEIRAHFQPRIQTMWVVFNLYILYKENMSWVEN